MNENFNDQIGPSQKASGSRRNKGYEDPGENQINKAKEVEMIGSRSEVAAQTKENSHKLGDSEGKNIRPMDGAGKQKKQRAKALAKSLHMSMIRLPCQRCSSLSDESGHKHREDSGVGARGW